MNKKKNENRTKLRFLHCNNINKKKENSLIAVLFLFAWLLEINNIAIVESGWDVRDYIDKLSKLV